MPSWAPDSSMGQRMINARSETLLEKPSFKQAVQKRHCPIPANGFYEWRREGNRKIPIWIQFKTRGVVVSWGVGLLDGSRYLANRYTASRLSRHSPMRFCGRFTPMPVMQPQRYSVAVARRLNNSRVRAIAWDATRVVRGAGSPTRSRRSSTRPRTIRRIAFGGFGTKHRMRCCRLVIEGEACSYCCLSFARYLS